MENMHQVGDLVGDRYRIVGVLGQGGIGVTYAAEDIQTQQQVALKALSFQRMGQWKTLELFEREAKVLKHLNHPAIPRYLDYFQVDTESDRSFYIAQQLVEGQSLIALIDSGWRGSEAEIKDIATQVLEILIYLHNLQPPVIHRDIKPQNLIRRSDGMVTLVDFGAVQDTYRHTQIGSSTVVGTYGYMPPEQYRGKALPASDLFSLGATILFMLTGRSPSELPEIRMKISFRDYVYISQGFADWLEQMIEPACEDRFTSAQLAFAALKTCDIARNSINSGAIVTEINHKINRKSKPFGSRVTLHLTSNRLEILVPPTGWSFEFLPVLGFALFWNSFLVVWTIGAAIGGGLFALFSIPFWIIGIAMLVPVITGIAGNTRLLITRSAFVIDFSVLGYKSSTTGKTSDLQKVELGGNMTVNDQPIQEILLRHGVKTHRFGFNLTNVEKEWLQAEIIYFLETIRK